MELVITSSKDEPLLSRTAIKADVSFDRATPSYNEIVSLVASKVKADEKLVAIRHVYTSFGNKSAEVIAYVYKDEAKKQSIEPKLKEKNKKEAAKNK